MSSKASDIIVSKSSSSSKESPHKQSESSKDEQKERSLRTLYRSYLSTVIVTSRTLDKISSDDKDKKDSELKKAAAAVVSTANKIKRKATILEERICGNEKESEALHFLQRSQATWDMGRKRKFTSSAQNTE